MNTVDALKDLYKTLCGKDYAGDPNPTDAEMISAIAKDAQSGGGGSTPSIPVITAEYSEDEYNYRVTSHTFDELYEAVRPSAVITFTGNGPCDNLSA